MVVHGSAHRKTPVIAPAPEARVVFAKVGYKAATPIERQKRPISTSAPSFPAPGPGQRQSRMRHQRPLRAISSWESPGTTIELRTIFGVAEQGPRGVTLSKISACAGRAQTTRSASELTQSVSRTMPRSWWVASGRRIVVGDLNHCVRGRGKSVLGAC